MSMNIPKCAPSGEAPQLPACFWNFHSRPEGVAVRAIKSASRSDSDSDVGSSHSTREYLRCIDAHPQQEEQHIRGAVVDEGLPLDEGPQLAGRAHLRQHRNGGHRVRSAHHRPKLQHVRLSHTSKSVGTRFLAPRTPAGAKVRGCHRRSEHHSMCFWNLAYGSFTPVIRRCRTLIFCCACLLNAAVEVQHIEATVLQWVANLRMCCDHSSLF